MSAQRHTVFTISPSPDSTLAVEIKERGLVKRKHLFVFEQYHGTLILDPAQPLDATLELNIEAASLICRDSSQKAGQRARLTRLALTECLAAQQHPSLRVQSQHFTAKALRGFIVEGTLHFRGADHPLKANLGFGVLKNDRLQVDADATLSLTQFGIPRPSSLFGLVHTEDEATLHAMLWGIRAAARTSTYVSQF